MTIPEDKHPTSILMAEDDPVSRRLLETYLIKWDFELAVAEDGITAWAVLERPDPPQVAILDWMMPGLDGVELCRKIRETPGIDAMYIILLTAKGRLDDIVTGLRAGANDYITKPFVPAELRARIEVGLRVLELQNNLATKVEELEAALLEVKQLQGLLPICSYCKKIRNEDDSYQQLEIYISEHSDAEFSHGICPDCYQEHIVPQLNAPQSGQ